MVLLAVEAQQTLLVAEMTDLSTPVDGLQQLSLALTGMAPGSLRASTGRSDQPASCTLGPLLGISHGAPLGSWITWSPLPGDQPTSDHGPPARAPCRPLHPFCPPYLAVPQQVLALTVLAAEVPGATIQLLSDSALAGLGAVSTSDTAQSQLLSEVLFVQQHAAWKECRDTETSMVMRPPTFSRRST